MGREQAFVDLNNSQEHPLNNKQNKGKGLLPHEKAGKRRIFSSAGGRKHRMTKTKNRIQTAKYINNVNRAANQRWRGGSQLQTHSKKGKVNVPQSKFSEKKKKRIPLGEYEWPESKDFKDNYNRPVTAIHGDAIENRPQTNYDSRRRNIQSRGKANPTGLSGTSQSSHKQEGKLNRTHSYQI